MRSVHDPTVYLRKQILEFVTRKLREALHNGGALPVAEIHSTIEQMIADAIHEAVQDAISEFVSNDE